MLKIQNPKINLYKISCYEIDKNKKLGAGSYSIVYMGKCLDKGKQLKYKLKDGIVAVKKVNLHNVSDKVNRMIKDEINVTEKIMKTPHPNIVTCIDIINDIDTIYIVMEYCDSGDVSKLLGKPLKENIAKYYFSQIINGLTYLSKHNIIHRDIKPKNILLTNNNTEIKICDFGFAKVNEGITRTMTVCGSPLYMAPELLNEKSYNTGVDIWAIGMILHELLVGYHPLYKCKDLKDLKKYMFNSDINILDEHVLKNLCISRECISLLKALLEREDEYRIKLTNIGTHSWLKDSVSENSKIKQKLLTYIDSDFPQCIYAQNNIIKNINSSGDNSSDFDDIVDYDEEPVDIFILD